MAGWVRRVIRLFWPADNVCLSSGAIEAAAFLSAFMTRCESSALWRVSRCRRRRVPEERLVMLSIYCLTEKSFCRSCIPFDTQHEVKRVAGCIDSPIQILLFTLNFYIGFIHALLCRWFSAGKDGIACPVQEHKPGPSGTPSNGPP